MKEVKISMVVLVHKNNGSQDQRRLLSIADYDLEGRAFLKGASAGVRVGWKSRREGCSQFPLHHPLSYIYPLLAIACMRAYRHCQFHLILSVSWGPTLPLHVKSTSPRVLLIPHHAVNLGKWVDLTATPPSAKAVVATNTRFTRL